MRRKVGAPGGHFLRAHLAGFKELPSESLFCDSPFGLIKGHAFIDGNKRIGTHVMLVFLKLNGISLKYTDKELIQLILDIASGVSDCDALNEWLRNHSED